MTMPPGGHPWHPEMQNPDGTGPRLPSQHIEQPRHVMSQAERDHWAAQQAAFDAAELAEEQRRAERQGKLPPLLTAGGFASGAAAALGQLEERGWPNSSLVDLGPSWWPGRRKQARGYVLSVRRGESDGVGAARNFLGSTTYLLQDGRVATTSSSAYVGTTWHVSKAGTHQPTGEHAEALLDLMET